MTDLETGLTRRALLGGTALALVGCTSHSSQVAPDPDAAALLAARRGELFALSASGPAGVQHDAHQAHLKAVEAALAAADVPTPAPTSSGSTGENLSVPELQAAARSAVSGANAALLASIAASHATLAAGGR